MTRITWPPERLVKRIAKLRRANYTAEDLALVSPRAADYSADEQALMHEFREQSARDEITEDEMLLQITHLHDMKVEFGTDLIEDEVHDEEPVNPLAARTGRYHGRDATPTERESGLRVEEREGGPLQRGSAGHEVLLVFADSRRRTAYDASFEAAGDHHARRREVTRLVERGFLAKEGTLPNQAVNGRAHVTAYRITIAGLAELTRLDGVRRPAV